MHLLQVVGDPLPETQHDFRVDVIVTPDEVIRATDPRPSPGIIWDDLTGFHPSPASHVRVLS